MFIQILLEDKPIFTKDADNSYNEKITALIEAMDILAEKRKELLLSWEENYPDDTIPLKYNKILIH